MKVDSWNQCLVCRLKPKSVQAEWKIAEGIFCKCSEDEE